jgi:hypothetical protein
MQLPSAIIFVNDQVTLATISVLTTEDTPTPSTVQGIDVQLQITETISFEEFNARIASNPNYHDIVHLNKQRILVILKNFRDCRNREYADVVMFVKQGIASVESCKFSPPGYSIDTQRLNIYNLLYGVKNARNSVSCCFPGFPLPPNCPPGFPPPICPPQLQTPQNPRPPERPLLHFPEGLGALELFGVESLELHQYREESVFGGYHRDHPDCDCGCRCENE